VSNRPWRLGMRALLVLALVLLGCRARDAPAGGADVAPLEVAVAANFAVPMAEIQKAFVAESGEALNVSTGSTGKLDAQIRNGAPFDVFLAADQERPARLEAEGLAQRGSRFTYAVGRLALFGQGLRHPDDGRLDLERPDLWHLAIANPKTAPYGVAARKALQELGLWTRLEPHLVLGENVAQTYQFVRSQGAELGLLALSSVVDQPRDRFWLVPEALHQPIRQDAVLLPRARANPAAPRFLAFLKSKAARAIIERAGYGVP
jgi:molybdate transport system substrate-binding protein